MRYRFRLPEAPAGPEIVLDQSPLTGTRLALADGTPLQRIRDRGRLVWLVPGAEGEPRRIGIVGQVRGLRVLTDTGEIRLERTLATWELVLAFAPIALVGVGGLIGGTVGSVASFLNLRLLRTPWPRVGRVGATLAVFVLSIAAWLVVAGLVATLTGG